MCAKKEALRGAPLDTLAQPVHFSLKKRAKSKWYTQRMLGGLLDLHSPLRKQYMRAYYCGSIIKQDGNTFVSMYCNSRACNTCNRIRTAKAMNGYLSEFKNKEWYFITLTAPTIEAHELKSTVLWRKRQFFLLRHSLKRKGYKLNGISKMEVTFNHKNGKFHPHIHVLIEKTDKDLANLIVQGWLKRFPEATAQAQDIREANQGSLNELFKYATKSTIKKTNTKIEFNAWAFDQIMQSLHGLRTFQNFGNIRKQSEEVEELQVQLDFTTEVDTNGSDYYIWHKTDWYSLKNGNALTNYVPPDREIIWSNTHIVKRRIPEESIFKE